MNSESRRFYAVGVLAYLGLLFAGIVIVLGVLQLGNQWGLVEATSTETHSVPKSSSSVDVVFHVLFTLAAVIFLGAIFGRLCRYFGQPPVIGEVIAGLSLHALLLTIVVVRLLIPISIGSPLSLHKPIDNWFSSDSGESANRNMLMVAHDHKYAFLPNVDQVVVQDAPAQAQLQSPQTLDYSLEEIICVPWDCPGQVRCPRFDRAALHNRGRLTKARLAGENHDTRKGSFVHAIQLFLWVFKYDVIRSVKIRDRSKFCVSK